MGKIIRNLFFLFMLFSFSAYCDNGYVENAVAYAEYDKGHYSIAFDKFKNWPKVETLWLKCRLERCMQMV